MAAIIFASKLNNDDSLTMPRRAIEELGLHPGDEVQVRVEAPVTVTFTEVEGHPIMNADKRFHWAVSRSIQGASGASVADELLRQRRMD